MPSRIDIGPEGGPFVAINENSNDLELQDINGNVIAVWDETEGQWDFKTNDLANVGGIDATGLTSSLDVGGNDLTNINAIDASSASVDEQTITQSVTDPSGFTVESKLIRDNPVPTPTCYFSGPAHGEGGSAFIGAALAPDGRVILAPFDSNNVGITAFNLDYAVGTGANR